MCVSRWGTRLCLDNSDFNQGWVFQESEKEEETFPDSEEDTQAETEATARGCRASLDVTSVMVAICFVFCIAWVGESASAKKQL